MKRDEDDCGFGLLLVAVCSVTSGAWHYLDAGLTPVTYYNIVNLMPLFIAAVLIIGLSVWLLWPTKPPEKHDPNTCLACRYGDEGNEWHR